MEALWNRLPVLRMTRRLTLGVGAVFRDESRLIRARAAITLTKDHDNKLIALDSTTGLTAILPAATGSGVKIAVILSTALASGSYVVKVSNTVDAFVGGVMVGGDNAANAVTGFEPGATDDTLTLNGTTTGGKVGDYFEFIDLKAGTWAINGRMTESGTEATPFSATV